MAGLVEVEITKKLPETGVVGSAYKIEGNVKMFGAVGAPPFVYARVRRKEWYKPEIAEETSYNRGWPIPITGSFTVSFQPAKDGIYQVSVLASPAPISLPFIGVFPTLFESDAMRVDVGKVSEYLTFSQPKINGTTFTKVGPGDPLTIICSITSSATTPITATGKVSIYQGAFWSTPGDLVEELTVPQFTIQPNETIDIKVETTADSEITSKDIQLFLLQDSTEIDSQRFQDAYSVEKIVITKQSVVYNSNQSNINSGKPISVQITWKNPGAASITPRFRVDIQGTGLFDSPLEGQWETSPAGSPGQVVTVNASSIPIPTDWQNGKTLHCYVMLEGVSGHWDEASTLFTVVKGGEGVAAVTKQSVVYNSNQSNINSGQPISVQIIWKNAGTTSVTPRFRVDIQGTGLLDSPLEGQWVTSPAGTAGGTVTVTASSIAIPTDWQNGKTLHAYVMLDGVSGHWDESSLLFTVVKGGGGAGAVTKQSVVYNNNQSNINSGQAINVQITWKNPGTASITPRFRVDIKGTGTSDTPLEGQWVTSPAGAPNQVVTVNASSIPIPTDWQNGKTLNAYVMLDGVSGHWDEASMLFTVVKGGGGAATLTASHSNGVCSYSFSGFQPNATVTLTVTQTGGYVTKTANASGAGSGSFNDTDPSGNYTLRATDSAGNSATATFTISITGVGSVTKQSVVYNNNQSSINSGQPISVQITWKNAGIASITPRFRVDIKGTGTFDTPLEGQWVTSPSGAPNQVVTVNASSIPIPTDWQNGKTLHAYVMLDGVSGHWDESTILFTVIKGGVGSVTKQSVVYNNNQSSINSGQPISVQITWKNAGTASITPRFRVDIEGTGTFDSPLEGQWVTSPAGAPNQVVTVNASSIPIPTDWQNGKTLHAYVMLDGVSGHWDESTILFTVVKGGGGAATLTASHSNGVCSYSFSGFQPNATVTLTVTQTGGYLTTTANASGAGSGSFNDTDAAGIYTLQAADSYGHSATATFTISGGRGGAATLTVSYSGGVVSFSFSGFQANATVTLTVTQTGGNLTASANASGSGSGSFYDDDPAGTYTLKATDSYGHSATATFTK